MLSDALRRASKDKLPEVPESTAIIHREAASVSASWVADQKLQSTPDEYWKI